VNGIIRRCFVARFAAIACLALASTSDAFALKGTVLDSRTSQAIVGAVVTVGGQAFVTDKAGTFSVNGVFATIAVRAVGYRRMEVGVTGENMSLRLDPFTPRALYLSFYGVGSRGTREPALSLIRETELNAVVIDLKGDRGLVAYPTAVPLAAAIGARRITTIPDLATLVRSLHGESIYAIARIVVFKDDPLATARPDLAVKRDDGTLFRDGEKQAWIDPFRSEAWDYNVALAEEAAAAGFDEIQFDYVRFPDSAHARLSKASTEAARIDAIKGFLVSARDRLVRYNVFLAIDVFGYTCWNTDDTHIGQRLEDLSPLVDYVSPMLYPSGFQFGIPGCSNPVSRPYDIVYRSLEQALRRTGGTAKHFRPWLQAFKDYAFDRRVFDADEVQAQIKAAEDFGSDGWMLWNPRNVYQDLGLPGGE
jgi:hypothetical protein